MTTAAERNQQFQTLAARYRRAVALINDGIPAVLIRAPIVEQWGWVLYRLGRDIGGDHPEPLIRDLRNDKAIADLIGRKGARVALPEGYDSELLRPVPAVELWKSHVTGEVLPNPWVTGDDADQQFITEQLGEAVAEELRIAAEGGRSYKAEWERRLMANLPAVARQFSGPNPFDQRPRKYGKGAFEHDLWASREQKRIERSNPPLARWLKEITRPLHANPFQSGEAWNLTRQLAIEKADPAFSDLLSRAASTRKLQLQDEALEAEEAANRARTAAQAAAAAADIQRRRNQV